MIYTQFLSALCIIGLDTIPKNMYLGIRGKQSLNAGTEPIWNCTSRQKSV